MKNKLKGGKSTLCDYTTCGIEIKEGDIIK